MNLFQDKMSVFTMSQSKYCKKIVLITRNSLFFRVKIDVLVSILARKRYYARTMEKKYAERVDVEEAKDS